jgi:electron transfer flavoprotein beta subunit
MKIAVLIAGVADPKWPLTLDGAGHPVIAADRFVMSPFDESALEIALRLRDGNPAGVSIGALVLGAAKGERIARAVVAYNIADVSCVDVPFAAGCDARHLARILAESVPKDADLVLLGREFGDCDNGILPPLLASLLGRTFFGRAQSVEPRADGPRFMRETQTYEQWVRISGPMLVSVTNDRRSRLRKPLLKNVIMARQARIGVRASGEAAPASAVLRKVTPIANLRAPVDGPKLRGATAEHARTIVDHIRLRMSA